MTKALYTFLLLLPFAAISQVKITGRVINRDDTKPVANASVFLNNATIGSKTGADGTFTLLNVKPGKYDMIVSIVGFESYKQLVIVGSVDNVLTDIIISPKTIELNAITIRATKKDRNREMYYEKFKNEFFGTSELAKKCRILNPELIDFSFDNARNILEASSVDFLEIENKALGYRIKYLLKNFKLDNSQFDTKALNYTGFVLFEKLAGTASEEKDWEIHRREVYEGSEMHFLRSAIANRVKEEGFRVLRLPLKPDNTPDSIIYVDRKTYDEIKNQQRLLIKGPDNNGLFTLINNNDRLYISYNKHGRFVNSSYSRLAEPGNSLVDFTTSTALFDSNGVVTDPHSLTYDGAWARMGVASLLPVDYDDGTQKTINAVNAQINNIIRRLKAFADTQKFEKAYLQYDKPYYAAGDTIYFKAYVTEGDQHEPSQLSGIINVELINTQNKISEAVKLQLTNGLAWGDFALPDTIRPGNYRMRAYTNWMRNRGESSFFEQSVPIGSTVAKEIKNMPESGNYDKVKSPVKAVSNKPDVQFLPEGGRFVAGNYSKIAFKAIGPDGMGIDIKGTVTDETGAEVCTFASSHLGMGAFNLVPVAGKMYKANITYPDNTTEVIALPQPVNTGYTFNLNNTNQDTIRLRVTVANGGAMDELSLVARSGGTVYYAAESLPGSKFFTAIIPKNRFPTGVVQFTLFNSAWEPLNERLVFINNNDELKLALVSKESYRPREKVKIELNAKYKDDNAVTGNFSVSVTDEKTVPEANAYDNTILSNLLLTSDLKGNVEQPGYYFADSNKKTLADLDLLMLTQGYRWFEWKQVLGNSFPPVTYQPENALQISGTVKRNSKPVGGSKVTLFTTSANGLLKDTVTDTNGKFAFRNLTFADNTKFVVQSKIAKGQDDVTLELDTLLPPGIASKNMPANSLKATETADMSAYLINQKQFYQEQQRYGINKTPIMLNEVKIKDKKNFVKDSNNLNGAGRADKIITADDLNDLVGVTISFRIQSKVAGLVHFIRGVPYSYHPLDNIPAPMLIVIDGNYADYDEYDKLDPDRVQSIEVLASPNFATAYGAQGAHGILVITTKRYGDYKNYYRYAPGVVTFMPKGFYKAREFYSPQYDNPHTNQKMADLRSTIYWNPNIITDKDGKASFSYFNADGKGTYRVVVEGIDADGNLGRQVFRYKVE